jgi:hypothetical protein
VSLVIKRSGRVHIREVSGTYPEPSKFGIINNDRIQSYVKRPYAGRWSSEFSSTELIVNQYGINNFLIPEVRILLLTHKQRESVHVGRKRNHVITEDNTGARNPNRFESLREFPPAECGEFAPVHVRR